MIPFCLSIRRETANLAPRQADSYASQPAISPAAHQCTCEACLLASWLPFLFQFYPLLCFCAPLFVSRSFFLSPSLEKAFALPPIFLFRKYLPLSALPLLPEPEKGAEEERARPVSGNSTDRLLSFFFLSLFLSLAVIIEVRGHKERRRKKERKQ